MGPAPVYKLVIPSPPPPCFSLSRTSTTSLSSTSSILLLQVARLRPHPAHECDGYVVTCVWSTADVSPLLARPSTVCRRSLARHSAGQPPSNACTPNGPSMGRLSQEMGRRCRPCPGWGPQARLGRLSWPACVSPVGAALGGNRLVETEECAGLWCRHTWRRRGRTPGSSAPRHHRHQHQAYPQNRLLNYDGHWACL